MKNKLISVIGGSGFLGSYIVNELLLLGYQVQIISRYPKDSSFLKTSGKVGNVIFTKCNIKNYESLKMVLRNSYAVINVVGILYETSGQNFENIHLKSAENVARACLFNKNTKLIYISALGVDKALSSKYAKSKFAAEISLKKILPSTIIIRPGLIFGYEDNFFNRFAKMASISMFLPLIGDGSNKFQPVCVLDVAKAVVKILEIDQKNNKIYELAGPKIYSFKQLLEFILLQIGKNRILLKIPFFMAKIMAVFFGIFRWNVISLDQVKLLQYDNVINEKSDVYSFKDLNIIPRDIESFVPKYLERYK